MTGVIGAVRKAEFAPVLWANLPPSAQKVRPVRSQNLGSPLSFARRLPFSRSDEIAPAGPGRRRSALCSKGLGPHGARGGRSNS